MKKDVDSSNGIAVVTLNRAPVNSFTPEYLHEINDTLRGFSDSKDIRGVIFTSGMKSVFSAGLELSVLYEPEEERLKDLWNSFQG